MPRYRVTIFGRDYDAMADLVRKHKVDVLQQTVRRLDEGGYSVDAIVDDVQMRALETSALETRAVETEAREAREYTIERHEDVNEAGKARQEEVSKGDDYEEQLGPD
jgi:regulator of protease activity HflC (stomatin/prohibitin superfamily)